MPLFGQRQRSGPRFASRAALACIWAAIVILGNAGVASAGNYTRFIAHLGSEVDYDVFALAKPNRIVVELDETDIAVPRLGGPRLGRQAGVHLITGVRAGRYTPGKSRIVVDLGRTAMVARSNLAKAAAGEHHVLTLDLVPTTPTSFSTQVLLDRSRRQLARLSAGRRPSTRPQEEAPQSPDVGAPRRAGTPPVVVIDPGHGGIDGGAVGRKRTVEKQVALQFSRLLRERLSRHGRFKVVLTRDSDVFVPLRRRVQIARAAGADLFVSIHADSLPKGVGDYVRGTTVYTLSQRGSDQVARALARSENASDTIAGVELDSTEDVVASILVDLAQRDTKVRSRRFADQVLKDLRGDVRLNKRPHRSAAFVVLKAPDVPSVLIELGYLSNADDERNLRSPAWHATMADKLSASIETYFKTKVAGLPF